jgi:hypothetical protein
VVGGSAVAAAAVSVNAVSNGSENARAGHKRSSVSAHTL